MRRSNTRKLTFRRVFARAVSGLILCAFANIAAQGQTTALAEPADTSFEAFMQQLIDDQTSSSQKEFQMLLDEPTQSDSDTHDEIRLHPNDEEIPATSYPSAESSLPALPASEIQAFGSIDRFDTGVIHDSDRFDCAGFGCNRPNCTRCRNRQHLFNEVWGAQIGGWLAGGILGNPEDRFNDPVLFNDRANDYLLNQLYFFAENAVDASGSRWDVGGRVDLTYGTDSRFVTVAGLERHRDDTPRWNSESDRYGLALPQAYLEFAAPAAKGLSLKLGHFYSNLGPESFPAPYNFFYSHSYAFLYGQPFTYTGALGTYRPNELLTMQFGYTQGWDTWNSLADTYGLVGRISLTSRDQQTTLSATVNSGEDVTGVTAGDPLDAHRHLLNLVFAHWLTERLQYVMQSDFGYQEDGQVIVQPGPGTISFDAAKWGGIVSYLFYQWNQNLLSGLRLEWFKDIDQSRLGIPIVFEPGGPALEGGNYYALAAGLNWIPSSNLILRPEVRWDWSDLKGNGAVPGGNPSIRAFDSRASSSQFTFGADLIVSF